ncbi:MAG: TlpA family protein disulfide reductase [Clostridiales Family XIII bacterium]|jgi:thiol-disulfide isomerase/thioredoxin|nr:TlpA family protein disulfide reductase [Clostridiales Family XIII bacterium]
MKKKIGIVIGIIIFVIVLLALYYIYNNVIDHDSLSGTAPAGGTDSQETAPSGSAGSGEAGQASGDSDGDVPGGSEGVPDAAVIPGDDPGSTAPNAEADAAKELPEAPDFKILDADGNAVSFNDLKGKPIVLNFWASWCPPCIEELPIFDTLSQELEGEVTFVMVDLVSERETIESGKAYIAENKLGFPVYFDVDRDGAATYGITSIPTTYFINADGFIETGVVGGIDRDTLKRGISYIY